MHTEQQPCCLSHKRFQYEIENLNLKKAIYIDALFRRTIKGVQKDKNIQAIFSSPNSKSFWELIGDKGYKAAVLFMAVFHCQVFDHIKELWCLVAESSQKMKAAYQAM